ncbi:PQQ-binding-like beta-propeller repeat protein [Halorussus salinus]|uniref:PQQ-binding-like beta-propeller repeat protein n=1 Tax=Halorussus salinus TaxID=1364935 RepID=UPI001091FDC3|nr:PQQ-binding-like beta-propeller repeat protein [Halorussus salinus]
MRWSLFLTVVLLSSLLVPAGYAAGQQADRARTATVEEVREPTRTEWNVTVNETESIPNRLDSSGEFVFVGGASFPSSGPTISPAVHVLIGNNTTNLAASKVVADAEWNQDSSKRFDGRAVDETLVVRYGRTISAVAKRGGEWKQFDLGTLDGQFETMFATDSAVFVVSKAGIWKYGVGTEPTELARYDAEYELESVDYADGTITFETLDDTDCEADGASGCSGEIGDGSRYGALDTDLNERWTQFVAEEYVLTERVGDLLVTNPGSKATFYARDVATGEPAWTWEAPNSGYIAERMGADIRFWTNHNREFVVNPDTGNVRWSYHNDDILYDSPSRVLLHVDGEYVLRNRSTGEVLARHAGPEPPRLDSWKWDSVATIDGGAYLSFTVDPAPTRVFVNTTTGETVTTFDPPKRVATAYEKAKEVSDELRYLTYTAETMGPPESFRMTVLIRGETNTSDLYKSSVFVRPSDREWLEVEGAPSSSNLAIGGMVQTDGLLLYTTVDELSDSEGVNRRESIRVRDLNGTYLGRASLYRTDRGKPMAESKEIPGRTLDNQYNQKLTRGNYQVEMAANGSTAEVLYVEPYGHEGDRRKELRFGIEEISPDNATASVEVACKDGQPRAVLQNPASIPLVYSVGGDETVTVQPGESRTVELAGGEAHEFDVQTTSGHSVGVEFAVSGAVSVEDGDTVVADCGRETGKAMAESTTGEAPPEDGASETDGSVPGFTGLSAVLALLTVVCLRHAVEKEA